MRYSQYSNESRGLPRVACSDPVAGALALAEMISVLITEAEAFGVPNVVGHLTMALKVAERQAAEGDNLPEAPTVEGSA